MANNLSKIAILIFALLLAANIFAVNNANVASKPDTVPVERPGVGDTYNTGDGSAVTTTTEQAVVSASQVTTTTTEYREEVDVKLPYYIRVDKQKKVISIYTTNEEGKYEVLVRQMICSTEENKGKFPDGMYQLQAGDNDGSRKFEWRAMKSHGEDMFAQYAYTISGDFMFHSVPYKNYGDKSSLYEWRYEELGTACTGGCIRLTVECAKWIYDNCPAGTPVEIMRSESFDPELIEKLRPPAPVDGWDPTDPDPENPAYQPMYFSGEELSQAYVLGKAIGFQSMNLN